MKSGLVGALLVVLFFFPPLDGGHSSSAAAGCTCGDRTQLAAISNQLGLCLYSEVVGACACCQLTFWAISLFWV